MLLIYSHSAATGGEWEITGKREKIKPARVARRRMPREEIKAEYERREGGDEDRGKRDARKEKSRSVTPWMRYATRYRPRCTDEKMEKREVLLETSVETSSGSKSRWRGQGESGKGKERGVGCKRMKRRGTAEWFQPRLIGLYCGGMTAVTRSRRAFASSSISSPLLLLRSFIFSSRLLSRPELYQPPSLSTLHLLSLSRFYSGTLVSPAIPKLNTADDSRALPAVASVRKKSRRQISLYLATHTMTLRLFLFLVLLSYNLFFFF